MPIEAAPGPPLREQCLAYLRNKALLLILDNFEQLLDADDFVLAMLKAAPDLTILITSRERLNLASEQTHVLSNRIRVGCVVVRSGRRHGGGYHHPERKRDAPEAFHKPCIGRFATDS